MPSSKNEIRWTKKDFFDSSNRHYTDALLLHDNASTRNAAFLFGISAECSVKSVLFILTKHEEVLGTQLPFMLKDGTKRFIDFRSHFPELIGKITSLKADLLYLFHGRLPSSITKLYILLKAFNNWEMEKLRYSCDELEYPDYETWMTSAGELLNCLDALKLDGELSGE